MVLTTFLCKLAVSQSFPSHLPDRWRGCSLGPALRGAGHGCNRCFFFLTNHEIKKPLAKDTSSFLKNRNVAYIWNIIWSSRTIHWNNNDNLPRSKMKHGIFHISIGVFWEATGCWNFAKDFSGSAPMTILHCHPPGTIGGICRTSSSNLSQEILYQLYIYIITELFHMI